MSLTPCIAANSEALRLFGVLHRKRISLLRAGATTIEACSISVSVARFPNLSRSRYHVPYLAGFELRWVA